MLAALKKIFTIEIDYSKRIYGFDVFRGIGVFIVVYGHGRQFTPFLPTFNSFLSVIGFWLMDLFFIQSGYLIGSILIKTYEKEKLFNLKTAYNFWIRRWLRTLPTYYLVLIIAGCLWMLQGNYIFLKLKFIGYLLFLQTMINPPPYFLMESWSLCIEEWFYLLFPCVLLCCFYFFSKIFSIKKNIFISILIFFIGSMVLRIVTYFASPNLTWIDLSRMTPFRMDTIAFGIFLAWLDFYYRSFIKLNRNKLLLIFAISFAFYLFYFYMYLGAKIIRFEKINAFSLFSYTFFFIISGIAGLSLTAYMKHIPFKNNFLFRKIITTISILSYSMYLLHRSVVLYLIDFIYKAKNNIENVMLLVTYLSITILLSILLYKYFEHPITEIREKMKR